MNDPVKVRRRSRLLPGLLVVAVIAIVAIGYWAATAGPAQSLVSPRGSTITEFSDDGNQTTPSFKVREGWAIHWDAKGKSFAFEIKGDRDFGKVIDIDEPGSGVTSPTGGGTFHLEVTADGPWSIKITQGD